MTSNTRIKIRYGLILQGVLAQALRNGGYSFAETPIYDADSEVPDFLIPDAKNPRLVLEVHQTDARDHFRMKTLRSLTAVAEAKAFFGADVVSVNVLFGDPDFKLPPANLRAICGVFDVNLLLRREASLAGKASIAAMEAAALDLAAKIEVSTAEAARRLAAIYSIALKEILRLLTAAFRDAIAKESLRPMWNAERVRRNGLGPPPNPGDPTYYKKNMVRSLFFEDSHFVAMTRSPNPDTWSTEIKRQAVATGIGAVTEECDGDHLEIDPEFLAFLRDQDTPRLRGLCKAVLDADPAVKWMFEDIRDAARRTMMASVFLETMRKGRNALRTAFVASLKDGSFGGILHERCWIADLMPLCLGWTHNDFNRGMTANRKYSLKLANPFNNITIRSPRLQANAERLEVYKGTMFSVFEVQLAVALAGFGSDMSVDELATRLLRLRQLGVMRMQRFDPLELLVETIARQNGCRAEAGSITSILSDLGDEPALGKFDFTFVRSTDRQTVVLLQAIAAEGNPRDKAKEWGARRLASLYRMIGGHVRSLNLRASVFVIDGTWAQADVSRLYRSGWTHVTRLGRLGAILREVFDFEGTVKPKLNTANITPLRSSQHSLPMAAEDDDPLRLKSKRKRISK